MAHIGIRLRIDLPGAGTILEADSDWLHLIALCAEYSSERSLGEAVISSEFSHRWHEVLSGQVEIYVQPVSLPDQYLEVGPAKRGQIADVN